MVATAVAIGGFTYETALSLELQRRCVDLAGPTSARTTRGVSIKPVRARTTAGRMSDVRTDWPQTQNPVLVSVRARGMGARRPHLFHCNGRWWTRSLQECGGIAFFTIDEAAPSIMLRAEAGRVFDSAEWFRRQLQDARGLPIRPGNLGGA